MTDKNASSAHPAGTMTDGQAQETGLTVDFTLQDERWNQPENLRDLARAAAEAAFASSGQRPAGAVELSVVFSNDDQVAALNEAYRGKSGPTNVLSFPGDGIAGAEVLLGDVVLALETIRRESAEQGKTFESHLCHLVVHGVLHLLGHDHDCDARAEEMEALESRVLAQLGIPNPYEHNDEAVRRRL